jgi:hypothetical protein
MVALWTKSSTGILTCGELPNQFAFAIAFRCFGRYLNLLSSFGQTNVDKAKKLIRAAVLVAVRRRFEVTPCTP